MDKPNIKYAKNLLRYMEWKIFNYGTQSYEDTLFIIFHFQTDTPGFNDIKETDEFKEYVKDIKTMAFDLINHICINFYEEQVMNHDDGYSVLSDFTYEYDNNGDITKVNLPCPIIDITHETKKVNSAMNICVQEIKGCTPHYLIMYTSYG